MFSPLQTATPRALGDTTKQTIQSGGALFVFAAEDHTAMGTLPSDARAELMALMAVMETIHRSENKRAAAQLAAKRNPRRGFAAQSLLRKYYAFVASGDWRELVDKAKAGRKWWVTQTHCGLPKDFVEFVKMLCERNQRKNQPAFRELRLIWRTRTDAQGKAYSVIPGYAEWPKAEASTGFPKGWTDGNLARHVPDAFELNAARIGREAASKYRRQVLSTRVGLKVGQFIAFDDQVYDLKVNFLGNQRKAMRPLGLNCIDIFSGNCFAYGFKPTLLGEDGAKQMLKEKDMFWFVVHVLTAHGYRTCEAGTTFVVEHGTAAINAAFEERILRATNGKVRVSRSGLGGEAAFPGLFEGSSKGNPRFKAGLESFFNLVRNDFAALPGQVGMGREHSPVQMYGMEKYNERLLAAARAMDPSEAARLQHPFLLWHEFIRHAGKAYDAINSRTDHALEGWEKAGLVAHEWRVSLDRPWEPMETFLALPPAERSVVAPLLNNSQQLMRSRLLSPSEVWLRGRRELKTITHSNLPLLLGPEFGVERTVVGGAITVEDQELSTDPMVFPGFERGRHLREGSKYLCYLNPFDPSHLVLTDAQGRFEGVLTQQDRVRRDDIEGIKRAMGAAAHDEAERLKPVAQRGAALAREKTEMHRHNAEVLGDGPTPKRDHRAAAFGAAVRQSQEGIPSHTEDLGEVEDFSRPDSREEQTGEDTYESFRNPQH